MDSSVEVVAEIRHGGKIEKDLVLLVKPNLSFCLSEELHIYFKPSRNCSSREGLYNDLDRSLMVRCRGCCGCAEERFFSTVW